jgi:hypothetical protein
MTDSVLLTVKRVQIPAPVAAIPLFEDAPSGLCQSKVYKFSWVSDDIQSRAIGHRFKIYFLYISLALERFKSF